MKICQGRQALGCGADLHQRPGASARGHRRIVVDVGIAVASKSVARTVAANPLSEPNVSFTADAS